ncbi:MAG: cytochrome c oxidase assembly protein [Alphaproteobacteria bacterium]|nr:cytochrome c oxidase assembly protein [Alphaproteobacteria bacterium]
MKADLQRRNNRTMAAILGAVVGMVGLAYASVPLYNLFCRVTGFGGTPGVAQAPSAVIADREITVRFDSSINPKLPWRFAPAQGPMTVKVGETALAFFRADSKADGPTAGTATFNVTPLKVAKYVDKIDCFCFTEQRLEAGESADMAVSFFVDPAIMDDRFLDDVNTITLSYTFFPLHGTDGGKVAANLAAAPGGTVQ